MVLLDLWTKSVLTMFPCFSYFQYTVNETWDLSEISCSSHTTIDFYLYQLSLLGRSWMVGWLILLSHLLKILKCQISQSPWMHHSPVINTECDGLLLSEQVTSLCKLFFFYSELKRSETSGWLEGNGRHICIFKQVKTCKTTEMILKERICFMIYSLFV